MMKKGLKAGMGVKAYKVLNQDLSYDGKVYEIGKQYRAHNVYKPGNTLYRIDEGKLRKYGFVAFETIQAALYYARVEYGLTRICEVILGGTIVDNGEEDGYKILYANKIAIARELSTQEIVALFGHPIPVTRDGKENFIKADGELLLDTWYDSVGGFLEDGIACIQMNGKTSYIDEDGKRITDTWFDYGGGFVNGRARVMLGDKVFMLFADGGYCHNPIEQRFLDFLNGQRIWVGPNKYIQLK